MCGIVGYWGAREPKKVIIDGLKRLEYRGYDSTGIAIFDHGELKVFRSPGKLSRLQEKTDSLVFDGHSGIGHTRWATHGEPSERNAHPHKVGQVTLVHNGTIENYQEIRKLVVGRGRKLASETDSELVAHLLDEEMARGADLLKAATRVIPQLKGAYSILVMSEKDPETLLAFKNGPPMVVGVGSGEVIIASDVQAIIEFTDQVVYMNDGEIVVTTKDAARFFDQTGAAIKKSVQTVKWDAAMAEKAGFEHFMKKEIFEQPRALIQTMEPHIVHGPLRVELRGLGFSDGQLLDFKRVQFIACGTSWHAALVGKYLIEKLARLPVEVDIASEFRYRNPVIDSESLVIVVSQSGETADTLACLREAHRLGCKVLSICNVPHSSIDREADGRIYTDAGPEIGVASTKAFTSQICAIEMLALHLARIRETLSPEEVTTYTQALLSLPSQVETCLNHDAWFKEAAHDFIKFKGFLYLGRGICYPVALEGALKLKEITYLHAEGFPSGELKHGPIALVDPEMAIVVMAPQDDIYDKNVSSIEQVRARGGKIIAIGSGDDKKLQSLAEHYLPLPEAPWTSSPILAAVPVQLLSYHMASALGRDVDQPRNLAKSVTVE